MAITKQRKDELVAEYIGLLQQSKGVVVTEYRGMTVKQLDALRAKLRENNSSFTVTKNTLLKIALSEVGMAVPEDLLKGPAAIISANEDLAGMVKTVLDFSNGQELLIVKGGVVGESIFHESQLEMVSNLPSIDVLRAQLLGMISMPMSQLVGLLEEPARQLVAVVKAGSDGLVNVLAAYVQKEEAA
ncbi:MAG TPA: 50S ribosomal protein L10 [Aggregatilinea sp.]|uniref:50S ribosomal protein L10 n=1 Tax=Aggregatilinea sp. TaxID=2806333 RepID=UPI002C14C04C|nr:50S ribosomal protein L10 [Aggregatilinea sp.]HML20427.1 50S ribosomal protein L10 [Aggregatilinea sp.]